MEHSSENNHLVGGGKHQQEHEHITSDHKQHNLGRLGPESAKDFLRRFYIVTVLLIPLAIFSKFGITLLSIPDFPARGLIEFFIASGIFYFSLIFFKHAFHEIKTQNFGMMTLVSLAIGAGYLFSASSTFIPAIKEEFYLEITTLIWILLFGHFLEARSSSAAGSALQEVAKLLPSHAHLLINGKMIDVNVVTLKKGDHVLIKPGEKVPADGIIVKGEAHFNEAHITGESIPIRKSKGEKIVAGSICDDGSVEAQLDKVGENSTIAQIEKLISEAQESKPATQRIADRAARILTFTAITVSIFTLLIWSLIIGQTFVFAITLGISVLVIACPHALGLAIPTVSTIATSLAVKNGVFLKDLSKLEIIKDIDYVVFDKTGTLTRGKLGVTDVISFSETTNIPSQKLTSHQINLIQIAASLEAHSTHVIGRSIVDYAIVQGVNLKQIDSMKTVAGKGIFGEMNKVIFFIGNKSLIQEKGKLDRETEKLYDEMSAEGKTVILVANNESVIGLIALEDEIKPEAFETIINLNNMDVKTAMLTGDNELVAKGVATKLKIETYFSQVIPEKKYEHIKTLQDEGYQVMMVGDGVNDAPALTQADVGVAIGAGTDIAVEAGDVVLTRNNPLDIQRLIMLSKKAYRKMVQNLIWALGYNVIAIPAAAGLFIPLGFRLTPAIGAILMSMSSVIVVFNAMTLRKEKLKV